MKKHVDIFIKMFAIFCLVGFPFVILEKGILGAWKEWLQIWRGEFNFMDEVGL